MEIKPRYTVKERYELNAVVVKEIHAGSKTEEDIYYSIIVGGKEINLNWETDVEFTELFEGCKTKLK